MAGLLRAPVREYRVPAIDSRNWDDYRPRSGDSVVATYRKVGSTWTQRIVDMLIHQSVEPRPIMETYPWIDATFMGSIEEKLAFIESQTHRRSLKSHLPFDSLPVFEEVRYIHVARDGRDVCLSEHNHSLGMKSEVMQQIRPGGGQEGKRPIRPIADDPRGYFNKWIDDAEAGGAHTGMMPFLDFEMTYWRERHLPNLLLVHYDDLKTNLAGEIARIADFLEIATSASKLSELAHAAEFETMRAAGKALLPGVGQRLDRGHERFLDKGITGRWKGVLQDEDLARYTELVAAKVTPAAAAWIEGGRSVAGDPRDAPD